MIMVVIILVIIIISLVNILIIITRTRSFATARKIHPSGIGDPEPHYNNSSFISSNPNHLSSFPGSSPEEFHPTSVTFYAVLVTYHLVSQSIRI